MKVYSGTMIKKSGDKTIAVEVTRQWVHPKYKKTVKRTKKYLVHDAANQKQIGDQITFAETKPYSKRKRFSLI